jgi:hypothetical protein
MPLRYRNTLERPVRLAKYLKNAAFALLLPLAAACAADGTESGGLDWSKSTTYNVKTGRGDRVTLRVLGDGKDSYDYQARIRHTTRSDTDPLDRQRVLRDASRVVVGKLCAKGANNARPHYASNNYEEFGRFVCAVK